MRKLALIVLAIAGAAVLAAATRDAGPQASQASSHREAPLISEDPTADNTDLYAFRSPDKPNTLTIVSNWIPGEDPAAGPNYYTFSPTRPVQHLHRPERRREAGRSLPLPASSRKTGAVLPRQHACSRTRSTKIVGTARQIVATRQDADEQHRPALTLDGSRTTTQLADEASSRAAGRRQGLRRPA